ncbi:MAG: type I restriction enzyme HsdR N-terminal domain-containing protein [Proteobacteria bacterium]|nr:type I restriction enzyme HsdR N-terminal domain-containing protein [Pseudomonadota bacterium]MBU4287650.1 type I restriction enzyme HsdR N-terminal domain-containing protein [Pseudomonadota bacterium]MBU4415130.1 type I restriction enzyme HsdR N-terminal domain-containing protein [Pseudomonadota bacterium]MCG2757218.1 type I restriction enzyme HsdR N-terminal domain-containing protein [Desulfobacteraceae bacterium]
MDNHHLILGELVDFITGETITDTHDERYRQKLAKILVTTKGYHKYNIKPRCNLLVKAANKSAVVIVDFKVILNEKVCMIVKYAPGSLITRHRPALAASRLIASYQVPVVVVTNGEDTNILDGSTGKVTGYGFESIPSKAELSDMVANKHFDPVPIKKAEIESRIIYAYEVDGSCSCDKTTCEIKT